MRNIILSWGLSVVIRERFGRNVAWESIQGNERNRREGGVRFVARAHTTSLKTGDIKLSSSAE